MFIIVNIGNTNTGIGLVRGKKIFAERKRTDTLKTADDFKKTLSFLLFKHGWNGCKPEGAILASVVPLAIEPCVHALADFTGVTPLVVDKYIKTGVDFSHYTDLLGSDRISVCAAAWNRFKAPLAVIDMGTATTFNVVDQNGIFIGGAILPGLRMGLEALNRHTAQIPNTGLMKQAKVIGRNTEECLLAGAYYGTAAMVNGLIEDVSKTLGENVEVILTGGNAGIVKPYIKIKLTYEPDLLLQGLVIIYLSNKQIFAKSTNRALQSD